MDVDQATARAWADAGIIPVSRYVELCKEKGWSDEDRVAWRAAVDRAATDPDRR